MERSHQGKDKHVFFDWKTEPLICVSAEAKNALLMVCLGLRGGAQHLNGPDKTDK